MTEERIFQRPETVPIHAEVRTDLGVLTDPTSIVVTVTAPGGAVPVNGVAMTKDSTGKYTYYFGPSSVAPLGWYKVKTIVVDGSGGTALTTITLKGFTLQ